MDEHKLFMTGGDAMKVRTKYWMLSLWVLAITFGLMVTSAQTASKFPPAIEKLIPQAKAEGEVSLFTGSVKVTVKEAERFSQAFSNYYGIPIKVTLAALGSHPEVVQR
jgi:hypothetical protein